MHRILAYRSDRQMQKTVCQFIGHFPGHQFLLKTKLSLFCYICIIILKIILQQVANILFNVKLFKFHTWYE